MTSSLANYYDAFIDAVIGRRDRPLAAYLEDGAVLANAIVYRNTVFRGAADALASAFPAVARLAGEAYFERVAVAYVQARPARKRSLVGYGEDFADFLEQAPGVSEAPYLADAARLDRAWLEAHRAPSRPPLAAAAFVAVGPERLAELRLRLHPSLHIASLNWSVHGAWKHNRSGAAPIVQQVCKVQQHVLLWRSLHEVETQEVSAAEARFFAALRERRTLGAAAEEALAISNGFNTSLVFAGAIEAGMFDTEQPDLESQQEPWW